MDVPHRQPEKMETRHTEQEPKHWRKGHRVEGRAMRAGGQCFPGTFSLGGFKPGDPTRPIWRSPGGCVVRYPFALS